ncbi:MAG: RNA polymerase sigma factor [Bacteroidales bacterium]|nr:RNA polymerase sigma factor [Bacteroidales bacterium]MDP3002114.1 RNA polymerase sigma factor [Bacteroidales bacterium]
MSFDEVYRKHYHELRRFGRQLNVSVEKCEDLTQEAFLRYYLELKKDVVFDNPRAWLYKVFLNLFKTHINSTKNELRDSELLVRAEEPSGDLQEEYTKNEKQRIVLEMLDQLTKKEKELLLLYHNGFSYSEMAEIMEINPNSVGKTLVRAIERLKKTIKIQYHEMFE